MIRTSCEHPQCKNNPYCWIEAQSKFHNENEEKLYPNENPPENGVWKDGKYVKNT